MRLGIGGEHGHDAVQVADHEIVPRDRLTGVGDLHVQFARRSVHESKMDDQVVAWSHAQGEVAITCLQIRSARDRFDLYVAEGQQDVL